MLQKIELAPCTQPPNGVNFELVLYALPPNARLHTRKAPIAKPQWSYFPLKIKTLDTLIPPWRMTCNLKSFGASEEEVQDFGPKTLSLWPFLLGQWCQCGHLRFILWLV